MYSQENVSDSVRFNVTVASSSAYSFTKKVFMKFLKFYRISVLRALLALNQLSHSWLSV